MSRLMAFVASDPDRTKCLLAPGRKQLVSEEATSADGWGIGFYQGGEVLLQRRPKSPGGPLDFYQLVGDLRTDVLVGHVREATVGAAKNENTHPFRFRSWLFAHHGTLPGWDGMKQRIVSAIPDFLRRNIRGQTDSEHLFHLFLSFLHEQNRIDDPMLGPQPVAEALGRALGIVETVAPGATRQMDLVATNGRLLVALRRHNGLYWYRVDGVQDCEVCREADFGRGTKRVDHEHLRGVVIVGGVSGDKEPGAPWQKLADDHVLAVEHDLTSTILPLAIAGL